MHAFDPKTRSTIDRLRLRDHERVGEAGRSMLLLHGEVRPLAVLLFHGMAASPAQFARFAHELHAHGHNVIVPRLPRHGHADRFSDALAHLTATDLRAFARENTELAGGLGERVAIGGFSLGGLLATWAAQRFAVERAVAIAPFFGISWMPNRLMGSLARVLLALPNQFHWWNPMQRERQQPEHGYPRYATHAIAQMYLLAREVIDDADRGVAARRLIFVTNDHEAAVNNRAVRRLEERMRAAGAAGLEHIIISGIPFSHDIIEPSRHPALAAQVFPRLLGLLEGTRGEG
jgi:alpha-beta hydrolase superfamily lysophospholipase